VKEELEKLIRAYEEQEGELKQIEKQNPKFSSQVKKIRNTVVQYKKYFENLNGWTLRNAENINSRIDLFFSKGEKKVEEEKKEIEIKLTKLQKMKELFKKI
jgi:cell division septum initiation protein DivIVA